MNEQAIKEIRNREASLHNCEGINKLREALTAIWPNDLSSKSSQGMFNFYLLGSGNSWEPEDENPLPKSYTPSEVFGYVKQKELTKKELLEEAWVKYKGRKFKCLHDCDNMFVTNKYFLEHDDGCIRYVSGYGCGCLYENGNWAEIIEEPNLSFDKTRAKNIITEIKAKTKELETIFNKLYSNNGNKS